MATVLNPTIVIPDDYRPSEFNISKIWVMAQPLYKTKLPKIGEIYLTRTERDRLKNELKPRLHKRYLLV